ncbi:MAG: hypothetical protein KAR19_17090 [Bacteroidales bacterium]|nr:hypothetical protein [Bacteroidales bacterium]
MKALYIVPVLALLMMVSCFNLEEEPIVQINPTVELSAHIKDRKIFATALINVNSQILTTGNIPTLFKISGELAIYNTATGNIIDVNAFSGGGLSQVYTVTADTTSHRRFIVIASGTVNAYADIGNDNDESNDKLVSSGDFYQESQFIISDLLPQTPQ